MSAGKKRTAAEDNDWLIVTGLNGKELPGIKDALMRKIAREEAKIEQPAKGLKKKKEGTR